ncbi:hypothetical protein CDD81_5538 [Ophiocordyceps australis]|uniref:60S ribosomal subunit assembly/export protein LOC1 n=1 Tax=Ophiocordyceps australis TaxID=1399860 RepID=A0A2C5Y818_9HYPO|nr:hypothetical protein CDD81_5538 [Ophiocordyceps australis]
MAPSKTRTVKNKHSAPKRSSTDGISKSRKQKPTRPTAAQQVKEKNRALLKKPSKSKTYTAEELGVPKLNMITPVGVVKPRGKKKGKVFVDDMESMNTILAMVQANKNGQIESKMIKARQMEEIRQARKEEAEKKEQERKNRLQDTKDSLRKKRRRASKPDIQAEDQSIKSLTLTGSKAAKPKRKVSFA